MERQVKIGVSKFVRLIQIIDKAKYASTPKERDAYVKSELGKEEEMRNFLKALTGGGLHYHEDDPKKEIVEGPKEEPKVVTVEEEVGDPVKKD